MFSSTGDLATHSNNNHSGDRLFRTLERGDKIRMRKGVEFLEIEFDELDLGFGKYARAKIKDDIPEKIIKENYNLWTIEEIVRNDEIILIDKPLDIG